MDSVETLLVILITILSILAIVALITVIVLAVAFRKLAMKAQSVVDNSQQTLELVKVQLMKRTGFLDILRFVAKRK